MKVLIFLTFLIFLAVSQTIDLFDTPASINATNSDSILVARCNLVRICPKNQYFDSYLCQCRCLASIACLPNEVLNDTTCICEPRPCI